MSSTLAVRADAVLGRARSWAACRQLIRRCVAAASAQSPYEIFESVVATLVKITIVVMVAKGLWHLAKTVCVDILANTDVVADQVVFQSVFGTIFTLLIAMEFKRSIHIGRATRDIVNIRPIILIAMLATVRRFIVADLGHMDITDAVVTGSGRLVNHAGDPGQSSAHDGR